MIQCISWYIHTGKMPRGSLLCCIYLLAILPANIYAMTFREFWELIKWNLKPYEQVHMHTTVNEISDLCEPPSSYKPYSIVLTPNYDSDWLSQFTEIYFKMSTYPVHGTLYHCLDAECTQPGPEVNPGWDESVLTSEWGTRGGHLPRFIYVPNVNYYNRVLMNKRTLTSNTNIDTRNKSGSNAPIDTCVWECPEKLTYYMYTSSGGRFFFTHTIDVINRPSALQITPIPGDHLSLATAVEVKDVDDGYYTYEVHVQFNAALSSTSAQNTRLQYNVYPLCRGTPPSCVLKGGAGEIVKQIAIIPLPAEIYTRAMVRLMKVELRDGYTHRGDYQCRYMHRYFKSVYVTLHNPPATYTHGAGWSGSYFRHVILSKPPERGRFEMNNPGYFEYDPYNKFSFSSFDGMCYDRFYDEFEITARLPFQDSGSGYTCMNGSTDTIRVCKKDTLYDPAAYDIVLESAPAYTNRTFTIYAFDPNDGTYGEDDLMYSWNAFQKPDGTLMPNAGVFFEETEFMTDEGVYSYIARWDCEGGPLDKNQVHHDLHFCFVSGGYHGYIYTGYYLVDNNENVMNVDHSLGEIEIEPTSGILACSATESDSMHETECTANVEEQHDQHFYLAGYPIKIAYEAIGKVEDFKLKILSTPRHGKLWFCHIDAYHPWHIPKDSPAETLQRECKLLRVNDLVEPDLGNDYSIIYNPDYHYFNYHVTSYEYLIAAKDLLNKYGPYNEYDNRFSTILDFIGWVFDESHYDEGLAAEIIDRMKREHGGKEVVGFVNHYGEPFNRDCAEPQWGCPDFFTFTIDPPTASVYRDARQHRFNIWVKNVPSYVYFKFEHNLNTPFKYKPGEDNVFPRIKIDDWDKGTYPLHLQFETHTSDVKIRNLAGNDTIIQTFGGTCDEEDGLCPTNKIWYRCYLKDCQTFLNNIAFYFLRKNKQKHEGKLRVRYKKFNYNEVVVEKLWDYERSPEDNIKFQLEAIRLQRSDRNFDYRVWTDEVIRAGMPIKFLDKKETDITHTKNDVLRSMWRDVEKYTIEGYSWDAITYSATDPDMKRKDDDSIWKRVLIEIAIEVAIAVVTWGAAAGLSAARNAAQAKNKIQVMRQVVKEMGEWFGKLFHTGRRSLMRLWGTYRKWLKQFKDLSPGLRSGAGRGASRGGATAKRSLSLKRHFNSIKAVVKSKKSMPRSVNSRNDILKNSLQAKRSTPREPPKPNKGPQQKNKKNDNKKPTKRPTPKPTKYPTATKRPTTKSPTQNRPTKKPSSPTKRPTSDKENEFENTKKNKAKQKKSRKKLKRKVEKPRIKKKTKGGIRGRIFSNMFSFVAKQARGAIGTAIYEALSAVIGFVWGVIAFVVSALIQFGKWASNPPEEEEDNDADKDDVEDDDDDDGDDSVSTRSLDDADEDIDSSADGDDDDDDDLREPEYIDIEKVILERSDADGNVVERTQVFIPLRDTGLFESIK